MARRKRARKDALQSEINVTPLVDVVLVLLIIFMVIVPLTLHGYDVAIPAESTEAPPERADDPIVLSVDAGGCPQLAPLASPGLPQACRVRIDGEELALAELAPRVGAIFGTRAPAERVLFLAADERLNYEVVMRIVDTARSGVDGLRIGMVTAREPA